MAIKKINPEELILKFPFGISTEEVEGKPVFFGQERAERAMDIALSVKREGYNIYVAGPQGLGRTTFTLMKLKEKAKSEPPPEDICYYHNFDDPVRPKLLILPPGEGKKLSERIDRIIEDLKENAVKFYETKEFYEKREYILKSAEEQRRKLLEKLSAEASKRGLGIVVTPSGIKILPVLNGRMASEGEIMANPALKADYERRLEEFQDQYREFLRQLRHIEYSVAEAMKNLRKETAKYMIDALFFDLEEEYAGNPAIIKYLVYVKENMIKNVGFFIEWKAVEENIPVRRIVENNINLFKLNVIVDNSNINHAPVIYEEVPTFSNLFGRVNYKWEMGVLYADHNSISAGSMHRARGGYLVLKAEDVLKNPLLWDGIKRTLLNKKIYMEDYPFREIFSIYTGIRPEPVPADIKVVLIGSSYLFHLLSIYDTEFTRLFKVKAEFDPVIRIDGKVREEFPSFVKGIIIKEGIKKEVSSDGLEELFKYAVSLSGSRNRLNVISGYIADVLREAEIFAEDGYIKGEDIKRVIKERRYRSNLIEEKMLELIEEGKIIVEVDGRRAGQINGISVYDLGDISFGKPTRITANVYAGEKGIVDIEREVELSGPIHSKGVLILSGYIGEKYGRNIPLSLSASITFEQSYDEVEGDSASVAELVAILSAIGNISLYQGIGVTGSVDQKGNVQPVGGIKEKVEGFFKACKIKGLTGKQGVVLPRRNYDNLILDDEVIEAVKRGDFHIYCVDTVDDVIEILSGMRAEVFHRKVARALRELSATVHKKKPIK